jgi:2-methylcitrate dehydratase PrpD
MSVAATLGSFASRLKLEDVPSDVVDAARRCIVDTYGVTLAVCATTRSRPRSASPACIAAPRGRARFLSAARMAIRWLARLSSWAPRLTRGITTTLRMRGSCTAPPSCGAPSPRSRRRSDLSGRSALEGFIAGVETEYALGEALSHSLYFKGWWATALLGPIGAAAAVSRAMGLDAERTGPCACHRRFAGLGASPRSGLAIEALAVRTRAESGVIAALYAREGLTAPPDAFEHPVGFAALHNDGRLDAAALGDLGSRWRLRDPGVAFKLYPACSASQAATEAVLRLRAEHAFAPSDVSAVECEVTALVDISLIFPEARSVVEAQFSMPFAIACALHFGDFQLAHLNAGVLAAPELRATMRKVRMTRSAGILAGEAAERESPEGALVRVATVSGRKLELFHGNATGTPQNPMSADHAALKFANCAAYAGVSPERTETLLGQLQGLERLERVQPLYQWQ